MRVAGFPFDEGEALFKQFVAGRLVVYGETPQQRKRGALLELVASGAPLGDLGPRVGCAVKRLKKVKKKKKKKKKKNFFF